MTKHLHIVSLDVPYPPDYGGVFDLFYKLKYLHEAGIKIHLHCFEYGRGEQPELNKYCEEVHYYKRKRGLKSFSLKVPYMVRSRHDSKLLERLSKDNYPVLLEGIHCTYFLYTGELKNRAFVRLHNVEFEYYKHLAAAESSLFKKAYFLFESMLLKKYEKRICNKATFIAVSKKDEETYKGLGCKDIKYLPVFMPFTAVESKKGKGEFCLYHGNLSVSENEKVVHWLIKRVFNTLDDIQLIIAGKKPSNGLHDLIKDSPNVTLIGDLSENNMQQLISEAQVNILPSFNTTGVKIKLINALFNGRYCVVNTNSIKDTGLESLCHVADDANTFKKIIHALFHKEFTSYEVEQRNKILEMFDNKANADQLIQWIW
jgi:glycosyltransferase involved in cell wall biosynthesis